MTLSCANYGCGQLFTEEGNIDDSCVYHSQGPIFHEGMKGWSCCTRRVLEFEEFMKIPGCAKGKHSHTRKKEAPAANSEASTTTTVAVSGPETSQLTNTDTKKANEKIDTKETVQENCIKEEDLNDPENITIDVDAPCKRKACTGKYKDLTSTKEICVFHSGEPVFHEGSKGWSCCTKRALEFDEFLKIKGCKEGKHRFTNAAVPNFYVKCRNDWYQTQTSVIVNIYAKGADPTDTKVTFSKRTVKAIIRMKGGSLFLFDQELFQEIDPSQSSFKVMSTKVEITLKKANGYSWASLEPQENIVSWTTFGTVGGVGSVGAKEAIVATDSPVHLIKK